jgi:hypothetical protein
MDIKVTEGESVVWIRLAQDRNRGLAYVCTVMDLRVR